jgi:hypothetical protein
MKKTFLCLTLSLAALPLMAATAAAGRISISPAAIDGLSIRLVEK